MPELPEVETVCRGLEPAMAGHVITWAEARRPDLRWPLPERLAERLTGQRVQALGRRSKYILVGLSGGETFILHLGMSGRILIHGAESLRPGVFHHPAPGGEKHDPLAWETAGGPGAGGWRIVFNDARRFGAADLWPTDRLEAHPWLAGLGPEPLGNGFSAAHLAARLAGRRSPVKAALLDQRIVAGLGNIYVCEALFRAGISPRRAAGRIGAARLERLAAAIRDVLQDAIAAGGSSLRDYRQASGELGYFQHAFAVYGREGAACRTPECKGKIRRIVQSGRSSFHCPLCQR
ncbi:MAG: bifunctional DNA-formamidopyrimidine glycosylase/DNA-(apurinic or apyrimidinic site) lyase [Rhodobacteraceae bacterium]|nr:bifunctional DNA-formamidopyrimidine glycosylase/DNA-(apurinic or apyrimidinic site) lyase [Paracoccaceae bacterium]